ncbi:pyrethroid hydrolase Ces2e-like [Oryzias latipes]|uniref:Carboxylic ester hydrolase n=1 Tax=Oryzias latipes TaxID=8090 RepID=H2M7W4_ORYLA|nr:pyrethroid hydrolase Ces2e-like [Oryzias latipes]
MALRAGHIELFLLLSVLSVAADQHAPEVHTKLGSLRGKYVSVKGKESGAHAFLGVPFAKPPVGPSLRMAAPQPVEGWNRMRDATKQPFMCIQSKDIVMDLLKKLGDLMVEIPDISEDCLYLNIYAPANQAQNAKLPVMVWIHGGGFSLGSASMYDGSALAVYQDVIVVLIQYRLGVLGFLSTGDEHLPGNFGLLDQIEALRWVKEHISSFGGDPNSVTVFGESAGGVSVSLLLVSPLAKGLIHRGIAQSGTAAMDMVVVDQPLPAMQMVANASGCSLESTKMIADCMKRVDLDTLISLTSNLNLRLSVNVDGHFLRKTVQELYQKREVLNVPFMTGINNHEAGWMLSSFFAPQNWTEGMDREQIVNIVSMFYSDPKDAYIRDLIVNEYTGSGGDRVKNRDGFTEMLGDLFFTIPAIKSAKAHRDSGVPVYLYEYQYPPSFLQKTRPSFVKCDHGDELFTVLGFCFTTTDVKINAKCTSEEEELSKLMMNYWGNFARTGSPNAKNLAHWPKYGADEEYLIIALNKQTVDQSLKKERFLFATEVLPEKIRQHKGNEERSEL